MLRTYSALVGALALVHSALAGAQTVSVGDYGLPPLTCLAPQGEIVPGVPVAALCGLDGRLDDPIDSFLLLNVRTRAGVVNPQGTSQLLRAGHAYLESQPATLGTFSNLFDELSSLPLLDTPGVPQQIRNGLVRALQARQALDPGFAPSPSQQALLAEWATSLNARFPALLDARPEPNRADFVFALRLGNGPVADTVAESAIGMAENVAATFDAVTQTEIQVQNRPDRLPFFIGPDGLRNTADDLPIQACRPGLVLASNGRCSSDGSIPAATDPNAEPVYYTVAPGTDGCWPTIGSRQGGGTNANGECVIFSTFGRPGQSATGPTLAAADLAFDPTLRPPTARLEPTDVVDLRLRAMGGYLPARPAGPGGLAFPPNGAASFARRVDPETGAPVNANGPLECEVRTAGGSPAGPDGNAATTADNAIPSIGNCLLFDNPVGAEGQVFRPPLEIAASHAADQAELATLCALSFDEDIGQCAADFLNDFDLWTFASRSLAGDTLVQGLAVEGYQFVRRQGDAAEALDRTRLLELGNDVFSWIFARLPVPGAGYETDTLSGALSTAQKALLGCGDAHASPCDGVGSGSDEARMRPAFAALTGQSNFRNGGGVDLLNGDASVLFQEFTSAKALAAGSPVGTRSDPASRFEAGVSGASVITPEEAAAFGAGAWQVAHDRLAMQQFGVPYAQLTTRAQQTATATDFQIEKPKWLIDDEWGSQGVVVFKDPRGPDGRLGTAEGADGILGTDDDLWDPLGEDCTNAFARVDPGCTPLEVISSNLERLLISWTVLGPGHAFDPPETVAEILAILDGDPANDLTGDPVAGPDGIRFNDFDADGDGRVADGLDGDQKALLHDGTRGSQVVAESREVPGGNGELRLASAFEACLAAAGLGSPTCYLNLDASFTATDPNAPQVHATTSSERRIIAAMPIGVRLSFFNGTNPTADATQYRGNALFPIQRLSKTDLQQFVVDDRAQARIGDFYTEPEIALLNAQLTTNPGLGPLTADSVVTLRPSGRIFRGQFTQDQLLRQLLFSRDADGNSIPDLDEDNDNAFDFLDDGTPGPVAAGNILCGSGVPGDPLQDAAQHELDLYEQSLLASAFPGGLPPRSPTFCGFTNFLLGLTGESAPGRRDFLWHGGAPRAVAGETDGDGFPDAFDLCPTVADPDQRDADQDGVGDACDNCALLANPRVDASTLAANASWMTLTGGQRDDDADGRGNRCDFDYDGAGLSVTVSDWNDARASQGKSRQALTCGASGTLRCAVFDHDGAGLSVTVGDFNLDRDAQGQSMSSFPRCPDCGNFAVLPCEGPACPGP